MKTHTQTLTPELPPRKPGELDAKDVSIKTNTLTPDLLHKMNAYWRAANYLSAGQIYLYDNPLLKEPLKLSHVKPLVVGHWGTTPGQNFIYVHLNRVIKKGSYPKSVISVREGAATSRSSDRSPQ